MSLLQTSMFEGVDVDNPLQQASKGITDAVSGFSEQFINPMSNVTDATAPGVALVDENTSILTKTLTAFKSVNIDKISTGVKDMIGGILNSPDLGSILTYEDGFKVDTDQLLGIAGQGLGFNIWGMADIKDQLGGAFLDELNGMTGGLTQGMFFNDGTKLVIQDGWELGAVNNLVDFMGKTVPAFAAIQSVAGVNSILNVMINETARNGMYQGFDSYADQYLFEADYHKALMNSLEFCIARGDLNSINKIFEIIKEQGIESVKSQYPDMIETMLAGFYFTEDTSPEDYEELGILLDSLLVTIGGPDWYKYPTEFGMAVNLVVVSYISDPAKLLLSDFEKYRPLLCSSGIYQEKDARDAFLVQIPNAIKFEN